MVKVKETPPKPCQKGRKGYFSGRAGPGRKKGIPNAPTVFLRDAMLKAAEGVGEDGNGKDGLVGFLRDSALVQRGPFLQGLFKLLPKQVDVRQEGSITINIVANLPPRAELPEIKDAEVLESGNGKRKELPDGE